MPKRNLISKLFFSNNCSHLPDRAELTLVSFPLPSKDQRSFPQPPSTTLPPASISLYLPPLLAVSRLAQSMFASPAKHNNYEAHDVVLADETCPLLRDPESAQTHRSHRSTLPTRQLSILCAIRLADPVAFTQIFPYVNEMMERFGVAEPSKTGFYSGMVVSVSYMLLSGDFLLTHPAILR